MAERHSGGALQCNALSSFDTDCLHTASATAAQQQQQQPAGGAACPQQGVVEALREAEGAERPLLLPGLVRDWPAVALWAGRPGLARLEQLAGAATVQVMVSPRPVFHGDLYHHQPAAMPLAVMLRRVAAVLDKQGQQQQQQGPARPGPGPSRSGMGVGAAAEGGGGGGGGGGSGASNDAEAEAEVEADAGLHLYLAQQPLQGGLSPLLQDVAVPRCLAGRTIHHTNLWMCGRPARSSLHYDPHHNLLAVVAGRKELRIMPPHATPFLYPCTLTGDSPNHSGVRFDAPDLAAHPAYAAALAASCVASLSVGDALFLPAGWWHQVDSDTATIAVNFWWLPPLALAMEQQQAAAPAAPLLPPLARQHSSDAHVAQHNSTAGAAPPGSGSGPGPVLCHSSQLAAAADAAGMPPAPRTALLPAPSEPSASCPGPGPGLRNLFALRQLARAAIDDIGEQLLAALQAQAQAGEGQQQQQQQPSPGAGDSPAAGGPAMGPSSTSSSAHHTHSVCVLSPAALQGLTHREAVAAVALHRACHGCSACGDTPTPTAAAAASQQLLQEGRQGAARLCPAAGEGGALMPGAAAGWLQLLPRAEAVALGLLGDPVAAQLAGLRPLEVAHALLRLAEEAPDVVRVLLTERAQVPAVACLLTRTFDQLDQLLPQHHAEEEATANGDDDSGCMYGQPQPQPQGGGGDAAPGPGLDWHQAKGPRATKRQRCEEPSDEHAHGHIAAAGTPTAASAQAQAVAVATQAAACSDPQQGGGADGGSARQQAQAVQLSSSGQLFDALYGAVEEPQEVFQLLLRGRQALGAAARRLLLDTALA